MSRKQPCPKLAVISTQDVIHGLNNYAYLERHPPLRTRTVRFTDALPAQAYVEQDGLLRQFFDIEGELLEVRRGGAALAERTPRGAGRSQGVFGAAFLGSKRPEHPAPPPKTS